jgi:hypothetical protein
LGLEKPQTLLKGVVDVDTTTSTYNDGTAGATSLVSRCL